MPRANRHFIPGQIWHITHRCHKRGFLLKFAKDRQRWLGWLFKARKRFGLSILDYMVTSNHVHLLVAGVNDPEAIPRSMQLIAGRTGQEYNQRENPKAWIDVRIGKGDSLQRRPMDGKPGGGWRGLCN